MKGVSPLIVTVILIAFSIALGGIVSSWLTSYLKGNMSTIGDKGQNQTKCSYSTLQIREDNDYTFSQAAGGTNFNVTVTYITGYETLSNFSFVLESTFGSYKFWPQTQKVMEPGEIGRFNVNANGVAGTLTAIRVMAKCGSSEVVTTTKNV
jgi:flagellin-like protein